MLGEHRVDLAQFDAEAADLHLRVGATDVDDVAVLGPPDQVTGAVHAPARLGPRSGHEARGGEREAIGVPAGEVHTGEIQLTHDTHGNGPEPVVQHHLSRSSDGRPDGHGSTGHQWIGDRSDHRGLGGAVGVPQRGARSPACRHLGRQCLTGADDRLDLLETVRVQRSQRGRRDDDVRDVLLADVVREFLSAEHPRRSESQSRRRRERHQLLEDGRVETRRRDTEDDRLRRHPVRDGHLADDVRQSVVADGDALRQAGGSRGVDHPRSGERSDRSRSLGVGDAGGRADLEVAAQLVVVDDEPVDRVRQVRDVSSGGHADPGARVPEHVHDALERIRRVDGQEGAARRHDRPRRVDHLDRSTECDRDDALRSDAPRDQQPGQTVGARVELFVRDRFRPARDGHRVRSGVDGAGDDVAESDLREALAAQCGDETPPLVVGQHLERSERCVGLGIDQRIEEAHEAGTMRVQLVLRVPQRVRLEVDPQFAAVRTGIDVQRQVLDRTRGQDVVRAVEVAEPQLVVEQHDVDRRAEQSALGRRLAAVATNVLVAVALPAQGAGEFELGAGRGLGDRAARRECETQRDHVGDHAARATHGRRRARRDRQAQDRVLGPRHAGDERGEGGDHERCRRGAEIGDPPVEALGEVGGDEATGDERGRRRRSGDGREGRRIREAAHSLRPVRGVLLEAVRRPVLGVVDIEIVQIDGLGGFGLPALHRCRVQRSGALDHRHRAETVERDVMDAGVPEPPLVAQLQHVGHHETVDEHVHRRAVLARHPVHRRGFRVGLGAQVEVGDVITHAEVHVLERLAVHLGQTQIARSELAARPVQRVLETVEVEASVQLDVVRDRDRHVPGQLLREPDAALCSRQRERALGQHSRRAHLRLARHRLVGAVVVSRSAVEPCTVIHSSTPRDLSRHRARAPRPGRPSPPS
ncbi:hypothetical protein QE449_000878 [Rhodococcus sp. SORGH_AS303]|nr:hypothetical protein [Rhodococcus sp. SORGH_AS_0303]